MLPPQPGLDALEIVQHESDVGAYGLCDGTSFGEEGVGVERGVGGCGGEEGGEEGEGAGGGDRGGGVIVDGGVGDIGCHYLRGVSRLGWERRFSSTLGGVQSSRKSFSAALRSENQKEPQNLIFPSAKGPSA